MKREYEQNHHHHNFQQLQIQSFPSSSPPPQCPPTSEDSHSPTPKRPNNGASDFQFPPPPPNDGSTVETSRRSRGRPPGSKNKPKPPVFAAPDSSSEPSMTPYVLHVAAGVDVVESTARFCRRKGAGLCFLSGTGAVSIVTLKQPTAAPVTFRGQFDILSISGSVFPGGEGFPPNAPLAINLVGAQGQIFGGSVVGPLISAGNVYLVAATLNNPSFERLLTADRGDEAVLAARDGERESPPALSAGDIPPIYSYQAADVVWAPSARLQLPSSVPPF